MPRSADDHRIRVLFLAASPSSAEPLRLSAEVRRIQEKIRAADHRDAIDFTARWAVRPDDVLQALLEVRPHILHFSGHATEDEELLLEDADGGEKPVEKSALAHLLQVLKDDLRVVMLNACHSRPQAEAITEHIDCAVGMRRAIGDEAACTFAASFYRAIAFGRSIEDAYQLGLIALKLERIPEATTPELLVRRGVNARGVFLIRTAAGASAIIYLKVVGTPHAYQSVPGAELISVGRQRRKEGRPSDEGNDVVIRVPGDAARSLKISRRHLEIQRAGQGYVAIDRSRGGTTRNGEAMPRDTPVPLRSGDELLVAGVLGLQFIARATHLGAVVQPSIQIATPSVEQGGLIMEASIGDMVTLED